MNNTASPEPPAPTGHQTASPDPPAPARDGASVARVLAILEVLLCSDYVTQVAIGGTLTALGVRPYINGHLNVAYVVALSLGDAVLLVLLIVVLLVAHGERPRDVLFGRRQVTGEIVLGVPLAMMALVLAGAVILTIQRVAPGLHTVAENPLQDLLRSRRDAWLFALVVFVAGGLREEIQRAFLLHRFDVWLGGPVVGLIVTSVGFGAGHLMQGVDASITTGLLGAFWGAVYLRRRSATAPIVSHTGFDLVQVIPYLLGRN